MSRGAYCKRSTNYEGAAVEFEQSHSAGPQLRPAYRELGETYFRLGRLEKTKEQYRKYLELSRNNCNARIRYASLPLPGQGYTNALNEINQVKQKCDSGNVTLLRANPIAALKSRTTSADSSCTTDCSTNCEDKRTVTDYEYWQDPDRFRSGLAGCRTAVLTAWIRRASTCFPSSPMRT